MNAITRLATALAVALALGAGHAYAQDDHAGHDHGDHAGHDHAEHAEHADEHGDLLEVGEHLAHLDVEHDEEAGTVLIKVFGPDAKTPLAIADTPRLNLIVNGKRAQVRTTPVEPGDDGSASAFSATDHALKGHLHGRVRLKIDGKTYQVALADEHDH